MVKGQTEFIVIFALILIAIVSYMLFLQQPQKGAIGTGERKKLESVYDSVKLKLREGLINTIEKIYEHGGLYDLSGIDTIDYSFYNVPILLDCQNILLPDIEAEISKGIQDFIRKNFKSSMNFFGKRVKFDLNTLSVSSKLTNDRVIVDVKLRTETDNNVFEDYRIEIPTKMKRFIDFERDFLIEQNNSRFLENSFVSMLMRINKPEVVVLLDECGETFIKTKEEMLSDIKFLISRFPSHLVFAPTKLSFDDEIMYNMHIFNGNDYSDIHVYLDYPTSWDLNSNFDSNPDFPVFYAMPLLPLIPVCYTQGYISYSFRFPLVVKIDDEDMSRIFMFAVMLNIDSNEPAACMPETIKEESEYKKVCIEEAECDARIKVVDTSNNSVSDAIVSFSICNLGRTDENGVIEAKIPCFASTLKVIKEGFVAYGDFVDSSELKDKEVVLKRGGEREIIIFRVPVEGNNYLGNGTFETYSISGDAEEISEEYLTNLYFEPVYPNFGYYNVFPLILFNANESGNISSKIKTDMYPIEYIFSANLINNRTQVLVGYVNSTVEIDEDTKKLCVYLPDVTNTEENINSTEINKLTNIINQYGGVVKKDEC